MKIQYAALDHDPNAETKYPMDTHWNRAPDRDWAAVDCAEDYAGHYDGLGGWEDGQSQAFALFTEEGEPLGVYDVTMEMVPQFHASPRGPDES